MVLIYYVLKMVMQMPQNHSQQVSPSSVLLNISEGSADTYNQGLVITAGKLRKRSDITLQVSSTDFSKQKYYTAKLCPLSLLSSQDAHYIRPVPGVF